MSFLREVIKGVNCRRQKWSSTAKLAIVKEDEIKRRAAEAELKDELADVKRQKTVAFGRITKIFAPAHETLQRGFEKRAMKWSIESAKPNVELLGCTCLVEG